jgi:hypothetical protein
MRGRGRDCRADQCATNALPIGVSADADPSAIWDSRVDEVKSIVAARVAELDKGT